MSKPQGNTRKKAVFVPFQKGTSSVSIDLTPYAIGSLDLSISASMCSLKFVESMSSCESLSDQVKLISSSKPHLKAALASCSSSDAMKLDLSILCFIYFSPFSFAIRKSMDWIIDYMKKLFADTAPLLAKLAVADACQKSLTVSRNLLKQSPSIPLSIDTYMGITFSLNALALIDRDVPWVSSDRSAFDSSNGGHYSGTICDMFELAQSCIRKCTEFISPDVSNSDSVSAEIIRYSECCADALRMVMNCIKTNWKLSVCNLSSSGQAANAALIVSMSDLILVDSCKILANELAHKDLIGSASMSIACIHWLNRKPDDVNLSKTSSPLICSTQMSCELPSTQLIDFVDIMLETDEANTVLSAVGKNGVHDYLKESIRSFSPLSKSAVVRAFLSVYEDKCLKSKVEVSVGSSEKHSISILSGPFLKLALFYCQHSHAVRFFGLQILESWFIKIESIIVKHRRNEDLDEESDVSICSYRTIIKELLANITAIASNLMVNWAHPAKSVSHMVPNVFESLVNVLQLLDDDHDIDTKPIWDMLLQEALAQSMQHRVRYHSLNILLGKVGASAILDLRPNLIEELVEASKLRDISSSTTSLVVALVKSYQVQKNSVEAARSLWTKPIANALTSSDKKLCSAAADFMLKEILVIDKNSIPDIISIVKSNAANFNSSSSSSSSSTAAARIPQTDVNTLFALVNLCLNAKLLSLSGCDIEQPLGADGNAASNNVSSSTEQALLSLGSFENLRNISYDELVSACLHEDDDLRYAGLTVLVICQQTCLPMRDIDFEILKKTFRFSLKSAEGEFRQRLGRIVKFLINRVLESNRISLREQQKLNSKIAVLEKGNQVESVEKIRMSKLAIADNQKIVDLNVEICQWLSNELVSNMYPGCTFEREVVSIEILLNIMELFEQEGSDSSLIKSFFLTKNVTQTVFAASLSNWDRSRALACQLLLKMPHPLPGFATDESVLEILSWGKQLVSSAKQRESETGAFMLKTVMSIYCKRLGWEVRFGQENSTESPAMAPLSSSSFVFSVQSSSAPLSQTVESGKSLLSLRCMQFISSMCDLLESQIVKLDRLFRNVWADNSKTEIDKMNDTEESYLCHGILNTILICISDCHESNVFSDYDGAANVWTPFFQRVLDLSMKCLDTAMLVIAEAATDVHFAPLPNKSEIKGKNGEDLAIPTRGGGGLVATYVNANSTVGTNSGNNNTNNNSNNNSNSGSGGGVGGVTSSNDESAVFQKTVVGAWLLVREAANSLAKLVAISPLPDAKITYQVLSVDDITSVGFTILSALGRLKHLGAISETQNAMQTICEVLLRYGDRNPTLCRLPRVWLDSLIGRLRNEEQIFILRRSAGFAFSFLSLLKAEPLNCKSSLLPIALSSLLDIIEIGIASKSGETWKMAVHSLNVVRMIILDAALGNDIDVFVDRITYLAMEGFKSDTWAIQNSSMMCFSAIVQRTIDNDKSGENTLHSCGADEYFSRYPKLYPYIVNELANVTNCHVALGALGNEGDGDEVSSSDSSARNSANAGKTGLSLSWPARIIDSTSADIDINGLHPSLYPILLMLSKFRSPLLNSISLNSTTAVSSAHFGSDENKDKQQVVKDTVKKVELRIFSKLIEKCRSSRYQYVRSMAAKALKAITPVVDVIPYIVSEMENAIQFLAADSKGLTMNKLHGVLVTIEELLGNVSVFLAKSAITLDMLIHESINEKPGSTNDENILDKLNIKLSELFCCIVSIDAAPAVHCAFVKILKLFQTIFEKVIIASGKTPSFYSDLLSSESLRVLSSIRWLPEDRKCKGKSLPELLLLDDVVVPRPYEPIAWRLAAEIITFNCLKACMAETQSSSLPSNSPFSPMPVMNESEVVSTLQKCIYSSPNIRYIFTLLQRAHESEIREGALSGLDNFINSMENSSGVVIPSSSTWFRSLQYYVIQVIVSEREPPVLVLALQVFKRLMNVSSDLSAFNNLIPEFYTSLCQILSVRITSEPLGVRESNVNVSQTSSAAYSLEILGYIVYCDISLRDKWLLWVDVCSREWQNVMLRSAAIASIEHFLQALFDDVDSRRVAGICDDDAVRLWFVLLRLIQDDDEEIRDAANRVVGVLHALNDDLSDQNFSGGSTEDRSVVYYRPNCISLYTIEHVDRSIGSSMAKWLSSKTDHATLLSKMMLLTNFVEETISFNEVILQLSGIVSSKEGKGIGDSIAKEATNHEDRVFEVEELNLYIEPVRIANVILSAVNHAIKLLKSTSQRDLAFDFYMEVASHFLIYFQGKLARVHEVFSRFSDLQLKIAFGGSTFNKSAYALYHVYMKHMKHWHVDFKGCLSKNVEAQGQIESLLRDIESHTYFSTLHPTLQAI